MEQFVFALITALLTALFSFLLSQIFINKDSEIYRKNFKNIPQFIDYIIEHPYAKTFYKGLTKTLIGIIYIETLVAILILWGKNLNAIEENFVKSIMLICTVIVFTKVIKHCFYKTFGLIK